MKFGEKVRDLRKKHSLTQDELAQCLGINKRTIIGWERDGRYPRSIEMLEKMADIFHVPLTYLQPDQSLFIERAAEAYGKKGKIEAQHLAFELTELFASGELTPQDMDGIMYEMHKAYFKYREQKREKERIDKFYIVLFFLLASVVLIEQHMDSRLSQQWETILPSIILSIYVNTIPVIVDNATVSANIRIENFADTIIV